ncbi:MAG TPA: DUF3857 domain-containing protein [Candidatus Sulfotelmatobacter sp.]|nr:DUF3857 domain-containing protein [Candidatus Sulfotelmatobacter sp.]
MPFRRFFVVSSLVARLLAILFTLLSAPAWAGIGFQPVSPDELKMTSEPKAPGAPAIILFREVDRDDSGLGTVHEDNYVRIKIFTEEGRKYADIEIPFFKGMSQVVHIQARTTRPDGSVVDFDGNVFEKTLVKARGLKFLAKTFTMPAVEPGCVIEYRYTLDLKHAYASTWILDEELFTKSAHFSLKPLGRTAYFPITVRWSWQNVPKGNEPVEGPDRVIRMEVSDLPAFQTEDYMPPQYELKGRVDFVYDLERPENDVDKFWKRVGTKWNGRLEAFVDKRKAMEQAVAQIISPTDSPEVKLRKIYERVQHIRNTAYEIRKTEQEEKRDKEKVDENVEDVWKRGYGNRNDLNWLFLALVRAAGVEAYGCWVADRYQFFFDLKTMQTGKLDASVVLVKVNGKELYFAPGAEFTPFGLLTWSETGVKGLRLDKDGGDWIVTPLPPSSDSRVERTAKLTLSDSGDLEGKLSIKYTGLQAVYHRLDQRNADDVARKKSLEESVKNSIPGTAEVELTKQPDWNDPNSPLIAEFDLKISGWTSNAGKRTLFPAGLFSGSEKHLFEHTNRVHPIYFEYPYEKVDDVSVELPAGWQVGSTPQPLTKDGHVIAFDMTVNNEKNTLHMKRRLAVDFLLLDVKYYPSLRSFFELVRNTDEEQIVLQPGSTTASK